MDTIPDLDRRLRWVHGTIAAMVLSATIGLAHFLADQSKGLERALLGAAAATAVAFWVVFPILYFCHIRKSAATLEYQDRIRRDEENLRQRR